MLLRRSPVVSKCLIVCSGEQSGQVLVASLARFQPGKRNGRGRLRHGQVQGVAGLIAGVGWVRCRWWDGCQGSNGPMPVVGYINRTVLGCGVKKEGIGNRMGVVSGKPLSRHGPVQGMMPVEGIRYPKGGMGWCVVVCQPLH